MKKSQTNRFMLPLQLLGAAVQIWKEMRFQNVSPTWEREGHFKGWKSVQKAGGSCGELEESLAKVGGRGGPGWRPFGPSGHYSGQRCSTAPLSASLLKNQHVYSFPRSSSFSLAPAWKKAFPVSNVSYWWTHSSSVVFMCWDSFCLFWVYGAPNKGVKLRGHRKEPNLLVEGTSTS